MTFLVIVIAISLVPLILTVAVSMLIGAAYIGLAVGGVVLAYTALTTYPGVFVTFTLVGLAIYLIKVRMERDYADSSR